MLPVTVMPPPPTSRQRGTGQRMQRNRASSTPRSSAAGAPSNRQSQLPGTYTDVQRGPSHPPVEPKDPLQAIGEETVLAIQQGGYKTPDGRRQTIAEACQQLQGPGTRFHSSDNLILDNWRRPPTTSDGAAAASGSDTIDVHFRLQSTLAAAREWAWSARAPYERIGVLSCAHPTVPGGGFNTSTGAFKSQEASLNRASNLSYALFSPTAAPFYSLHKTTQGINNGFFSNAMVYAQDVTLVRDDFHEWAFPLKVDVVNATPVDANEVQRALVKQGGMPKETMRKLVTEALEERMGRILRLFELEGDNVLILTGFGAGACGNPMSTVARIWARLLGPGGRFYGKFVNVIFAIPSDMPFHEFSSSFNDAIARGSASRDQPPRSA